MVSKKDFHGKHIYLTDIPAIQVWHALRSLHARGYVKEQFSWQHFYWFLTNEGIEYLRQYLHLPDDIVPNTLKKRAGGGGEREREGDRPERGERRDRGDRERGDRPGGRGRGGFNRDREGGGRPGGFGDKKAGAPRSGEIGFAGGRGRGAPAGNK